MSLKHDERVVTLKLKNKIVDMIDKERDKYGGPRSSWIVHAIVEKLERMGYDIE
jgi:hypothetical protein